MTKRKSYTPEFKAKVVLELLEGDDSLNAVASKYQISPGRLSDWRRQLADNASAAFSTESDARARRELVEEHERKVDNLNRIIGELTVERDYLQRSVREVLGATDLEEGAREQGLGAVRVAPVRARRPAEVDVLRPRAQAQGLHLRGGARHGQIACTCSTRP